MNRKKKMVNESGGRFPIRLILCNNNRIGYIYKFRQLSLDFCLLVFPHIFAFISLILPTLIYLTHSAKISIAIISIAMLIAYGLSITNLYKLYIKIKK